MKTDDKRFTLPLFTPTEAAIHLGVKPSTLFRWVRGEDDVPPLLTTGDRTSPRAASVPFIGLAEGHVLAAFRKARIPLQRIRPALRALEQEQGVEYALASRRLFTDGAEILWEVSEPGSDVRELMSVPTAGDERGWHVPRDRWGDANVVVDPSHAFGQPIFEESGSRVEDVVGLFMAGESIRTVAREYGVTPAQVEAAVRVAGGGAAAA